MTAVSRTRTCLPEEGRPATLDAGLAVGLGVGLAVDLEVDQGLEGL
jgi:hypothetical protein